MRHRKKIVMSVFLIMIFTLSVSAEVALKDRFKGFMPFSSAKYGGFYRVSLSLNPSSLNPSDSYEVLYYAEGVLQDKKIGSIPFFLLKNPLKKDVLEPVEHKFVIKDISTGEIIEEKITFGVFDSEHETFAPEYKGVDLNILKARSFRAKTESTDKFPPALGSLDLRTKNDKDYYEIRAVDDVGIKSLTLFVDGEKYSETTKTEKTSFGSPAYFLKTPSFKKEQHHRILILDTSENGTERTYDPKKGRWE